MADALNSIALDLGTTSIKAAVCIGNNQVDNVLSLSAPKITNEKGHYVSDAMAYLAVVEKLLEKCQRYTQASPLLGICFQRSSLVFWDSQTGLPVTPLISWQDNRGRASCNELYEHNETIRLIAGIPLTAYYFAPKVRVLLHQRPDLLKGIKNRRLLIGTLDSFLFWHWSDGKHYRTDVSMAARTLLMDIETGQWSKQLSELFNIPRKVLPKIYPSNGLELELTSGAILKTSVADQSAAVLACIKNDGSEVLVNLGTGGFVVRYQPEKRKYDTSDYLRTLIYQDSKKANYIAIEGTLNSITAALKPFPYRDIKIKNLAEIDDIYCIAEPSGIGAPYFRADIGLYYSKNIDHLSKRQVATLLLEGIIFRVALILEQFNQQSEIQRVYLSGGLSSLSSLQQGISLCSPVPIYRILQKHSGLQGVMILTENMRPACNRQAELILFRHQSNLLYNKFQRWKGWFSQLVSD